MREDPARDPPPHVYVHFPFCASKCPYCDFASWAHRDAEIDGYLSALAREASRRLRGARPRTLYFGGGTPTHPEAGRLERLLGGVREALDDGGLVEVTVEANPGTLDRDKVAALRRSGVTRVSLGAQTFHGSRLRALGRDHEVEDVRRSVALLREGGVGQVSLDLMIALPGQTPAEQESDVAAALALEPEHVSAYVLVYEPSTPFGARVRDGSLPAPDGDREQEHLQVVVRALEASGRARYEVSNFALPGARCRHNLAYWRNEAWLGLGAAAHSHEGNRRWKNVDDPARYAACVEASGEAVEWVETASPRVVLFETLMMGLRLVDGVDLEGARRASGLDALDVYGTRLARHEAAGLLRVEGGRIRLTARGLDLASYVVRDLVPDEEPSREVRRSC